MLGASRARACRARALALVLASLGPGGCYLLPDDSAADEECRAATTTLAHDGVFELERSGKQIEVAPIIATIEGTTSGVLQWTQVGRSTDLTLTIAADPEQPVTVFGDCDTYSGIDIPAHLELTSADGVLAERFVGQVSLDRQGRVIGGLSLAVLADRLQLESVLPSGFVLSSPSSWTLVVSLELGSELELPVSAATFTLSNWPNRNPSSPSTTTGTETIQSLTLGRATFGAPP